MSTQSAPDRWLEHEGARLRWRLEGSGPAIVLLHGWALDLDYWNPVTTLLAARHTVLRFDRSGFGLSEGFPDVQRNADDLRALLDAAHLPQAVLVGMSQGARLALQGAMHLPSRVRGLVLDGAPELDGDPELPIAAYRTVLTTQGPAALRALVLRHPLMQLHAHDAAARALLQTCVGRYPGRDLLAPVVVRQPPDLATLGAPTLVLNGALDGEARRGAGQALARVIPRATRTVLPGAGHLAALDDPTGHAQQILRFCAALPAAREAPTS